MKITKKSRNQLRFQGIIFVVLFSTIIALFAWLSSRYNYQADWTANNRNTLSEVSIKLLQKIPAPVNISVFLPEGKLMSNRQYVTELVKKYQRYKPDISLEFINPDTAPDKVREMKITSYGEAIVEYQGRNEHIAQLKEQALTNTLQRLLRQGQRKILFTSGHGERKPNGQANFDWGSFSEKLKNKGIITAELKLNETPKIPDASAIVIASPQTDFLPGEVTLLIDYIKQGGNLLWVQDPGKSLHGLQALANLFGVKFQPGTIVDPTTQLLNVKDPSFALITSYPQTTITRDFQYMTIFPRASGISTDENNDEWQSQPFLQTVARSWSETGPLKGVVKYDAAKDIAGPLTIGLSLTRKHNEKENNASDKNTVAKRNIQRIVILGDGDFVSNTYLGNQGNLPLGNNIINWLSNDDNFISIPSTTSPDTQINISEITGAIIALVFLVLLPLGLLVSGISIWLKRRKR